MRMPCGNKEVVELLERYIQMAKDDREFRMVAVSMLRVNAGLFDDGGQLRPDKGTVDMARDYAGDPYLQPVGYWVCAQGIAEIFGWAMTNRNPPPRDERLGADHWCYNTADDPCSFDFFNCLVNAEMDRVRAGAPAPLKVGFWPGYFPKGGLHVERREHWLANVFRPGLKLINAVEDPQAVHGHHYENAWNCYRDVVHRVRAGERLPVLQAPRDLVAKAHQHAGCVTITLREVPEYHCPERNSRVEEWKQFARWLEGRGENVIFLRDTDYADEPLGSFKTCPDASKHLLARAALYEVAKFNCFVSNGPAMLAMFGRAPAFMTVEVKPDTWAPYWPNTPKSWRENIGVEVGGQFPWSRPDQRIIWEPDTFDVLVRAWEEVAAVAELAAA